MRMMRAAEWILVALLSVAAAAQAGTQPTIQWPQTTINWPQLQSLFSSYPGVSQLNIQFPNQLNWTVDATQMQSLYAGFTQQAHNIGANTPNLSFSSIPGSQGLRGNNLSLAVDNATGTMQSQMNEALQQMHRQSSGWIQSGIDGFKDNMNAAYASLPAWFRSGLETALGYIAAACGFLYQQLLRVLK